LGQLLAFAGFFGLVVQPLWQLARFFYVPGRMDKVKRHRVVASLAVVATVVAAVVLVPLPFHVDCTLEVQPRDAESVFASVPGTLREVVKRPGEWVEADTVLVKLENVDLEFQVAELRGQRAFYQEQLDSLECRHFRDPSVAMQIPAVKELLATVEEELQEKEDDLARLHVKAPVAGQVFPPPHRPARDNQGRLPSWSGFPHDRKNLGAVLAEGDQVCQVGDPKQFDAILVIDQADIDLLSEYRGKHDRWPEVEIKMDAYRWETVAGQIENVASSPMEASPPNLASQAGGELNTEADSSGMLRPISTSYQARVPLDLPDRQLHVGLTGRAKVYTGWQPLGRRLARFVYRTFHFKW
jgi:putative peptide zinc metalloprotease protein